MPTSPEQAIESLIRQRDRLADALRQLDDAATSANCLDYNDELSVAVEDARLAVTRCKEEIFLPLH